MALYQPVFITPDVRGSLGNGVIDADRTWTVSWRVNGPSALTAFQVSVYENTSEVIQLYTTGRISDGCPFYGTNPDGTEQRFSYKMPAIGGLNNGNSYRLIITQWWSASESVTQTSASVFYCRSIPSLSIDPIGNNGVVNDKEYTFVGSYTQNEGDTLNWFRWRVASADNLENILYDTGNVFGTMDIRLRFDGLFTRDQYAVKLDIQTQYGVEADTGWVFFSADYGLPSASDSVTAECVEGTNAVLVSWHDLSTEGGTLVTPSVLGDVIYDGTEQSPTWNNYNPVQLTIGGTVSATDAGTYTATFTPNSGYDWGGTFPGASAWAIYRRGADQKFIHLADVPVSSGQLYDYGAASRQGPYTYYVFPIQTQGGATVILQPPLSSNTISPCYSGWSLVECAENPDGSYRVLTEFLFRYNFSTTAISNNNKPGIERNFTRYPTYFKAPQNYKSGSLSSLIGVVDRSEYSDTLSLRNRILELSTTPNKLFLKSIKGDVLYVGVSDSITFTIDDHSFQQAQSITLPWVEIGSAGNILKITALANASTQDGETQSPNLVIEPDFVALNVGETFTATATWDGGGVLSVQTPANLMAVVDGGDITVTAVSAGTTSIAATVSPSGVYTGQTSAMTVQTNGYQPIATPYTNSTLTYNGSSQSPIWVGYSALTMTMSGTTSGVNAGTYNVTFTPKSGYMWRDGTTTAKTVAWSIGKANANLTVSPSSATVSVGQTVDLDVTFDGDGTITVSSSNPSIATATATDTSTATRVQAPTQSNTLRYDGTTKTPTWSGYNPSIMTITGTTSGTEPGSYPATFTLASGYVWSDAASGWSVTVTGKAAGSATITVTLSEGTNHLGSSVSVPVTVTA